MDNYLYINAAISLVVLIIIKYAKGSNNANYYLSLMALVSWLIPYPLLAEWVPSQLLVEPLNLSTSADIQSSSTTHITNHTYNLMHWFETVFTMLMGVGFVLFIRQVFMFIKWKNRVVNHSSFTFLSELSAQYQVPIYSVEQAPSGFILGFLKPIIVISSQLRKTNFSSLAITHERQHIKNQDNLKLVFLRFCESLFWWNPFVRHLAASNHFHIETRCDQKASKIYGEARYISDLSALILSLNPIEYPIATCSVISTTKVNIARIKQLTVNKKMTFMKTMTYIIVAIATTAILTWNTLATANIQETSMASNDTQQTIGALLDVDIMVTESPDSRTRSELKIWMDFGKQASIKLSDNFTFKIQVADEEDLASINIELIEINNGRKLIIAKPIVTVEFGKKAMIEIDNQDVSQNAYSIAVIPAKAPKPIDAN